MKQYQSVECLLHALMKTPVLRGDRDESLLEWYRRLRLDGDSVVSEDLIALQGGFYANSVGQAFIYGYEIAIQRLTGLDTTDQLAAFCVTENKSTHPKSMQVSLSKGQQGKVLLAGKKDFVTLAGSTKWLLVAAKSAVSSDGRNQIKLVKVNKRGGNNKNYGQAEVFPTKLPNATPQLKTPISSGVINQLWDFLNDSKSQMKVNNHLKSLFDKKNQQEQLDYMYHRRRFQLTMLEATGLRPQELVQIEYDENLELIENNKIKIPTLKREVGRFRVIPIEKGVAIKVQVFMEVHRKKLIERLIKYGLIANENDVDDYIFLGSENAKKVQPDAAYQEFRRLNLRAGIEVKSCQSMFRHRFITNMVKIHFSSFMDKNPIKNKYNINEHDYRSILRKVAGFTDHKDPDSLFDYIDLAWEELDVFSYAYEVSNLQGRLRSITISVKDLKYQVKNFGLDSRIVDQLFAGLSDIEDEANLLVDST